MGQEEKEHYVYAICCPDGGNKVYVKFGRSINVAQRLRELKTGCPLQPMVVYSARIGRLSRASQFEKMLHGMFGEKHETGEWFKFRTWDLEEMAARCKAALATFDDKASWVGHDARILLKHPESSWLWTKKYKRAA